MDGDDGDNGDTLQTIEVLRCCSCGVPQLLSTHCCCCCCCCCCCWSPARWCGHGASWQYMPPQQGRHKPHCRCAMRFEYTANAAVPNRAGQSPSSFRPALTITKMPT